MTKSVLDGIPGLGPARKARLVKELGGRQRRPVGPARGADGRCRGCPSRSAIAVYDGVRKTGARR